MKKFTQWCICSCIALGAAFSASAQERLLPDSIMASMKRVAGWQFRHLEKEGWEHPKTDWTNGALYAGVYAFAELANEQQYFQHLINIADQNNWDAGRRRFFADDYCVGQTYSQLYNVYGEDHMIRRWRTLADSVVAQPHTESLEWTNNIHMREWAWCDALFMGPPALAYLSTATGDPKYLQTAIKLWWKTSGYLYSKEHKLYFRDGRYFNQKEKNGQPVFWSRGNGWVMGGLVRMMNNIRPGDPARAAFEQQFKEMAAKVASLQHADGTWHAALLDQESYPAKETSGTGFFLYAISWGINNGLLPKETYRPVLVKGWAALQSCVQPNGKLGFVQMIAAAPGTATADDTEVYGVGAYLLAGSELVKLSLKEQVWPVTIELYNPAGAPAGLVELDYKTLADHWRPLRRGAFKITNTITGEEYPYQILYEGGKEPVKILVDAPLVAGGKVMATLEEGLPQPVVKKTYGRYVPERKDDFAWENDRVAFRMYGRALEATPKEMAYGVDFWNKRTGNLVIDKWYKRTNYHKDDGDGLDYYHVGLMLGAGGIAPYAADSIWHSRNYTRHRIIDSGALRTTFELGYEPWNVSGRQVSVTKTVSIDAHAQLSKMEIRYSDTLPVAIGISKRKEAGTIWLDEKTGAMGYWEPRHGEDGTTGIGCVVLNPVKEMKVEKGHILTVSATDKNKSVTYYTGGAWDKAGVITGADQWFAYLRQQAARLARPVRVKIYK